MGEGKSLLQLIVDAIEGVAQWIKDNIEMILTGIAVFAVAFGVASLCVAIAGLLTGTIAIGSIAAGVLVQVAFYSVTTGVLLTFVKEWAGMDLNEHDVMARMIGKLVMLAATILGALIELANLYQSWKDAQSSQESIFETPVNENDLNHIFGNPDHKLNGYLNSYGGNQEVAYNAVQQAGQNYVNTNNIIGIVKDVVVTVNGFDITIRGAVIDGVFKIGTFFIP